ncbi:MAG: polymerase sigma-70 factor [Acidimicrobiales bacterium]|nr:polymerase sigma-70 factor [Acidimicrobiales bacterium]
MEGKRTDDVPELLRTTDDITALADGVLAHDPDAWESLYRRMHPGLYAYARRRLSGKVAAEDAVSEAMTRAMDRIDGFEPRGAGLPGWLFGILRNVVLEQQRAGVRIVSSPTIDEPDGAQLPGERMIELEQQRAMRSAFASLGADDRELLELRVLGGLTGEAAGEVLGMRAGAVRMAQMRALGRLRQQYRELTDAVETSRSWAAGGRRREDAPGVAAFRTGAEG